MKKNLENYKRIYKGEKRRTPAYKAGLIQGLLATTNNKEIRKWLKKQNPNL